MKSKIMFTILLTILLLPIAFAGDYGENPTNDPVAGNTYVGVVVASTNDVSSENYLIADGNVETENYFYSENGDIRSSHTYETNGGNVEIVINGDHPEVRSVSTLSGEKTISSSSTSTGSTNLNINIQEGADETGLDWDDSVRNLADILIFMATGDTDKPYYEEDYKLMNAFKAYADYREMVMYKKYLQKFEFRILVLEKKQELIMEEIGLDPEEIKQQAVMEVMLENHIEAIYDGDVHYHNHHLDEKGNEEVVGIIKKG